MESMSASGRYLSEQSYTEKQTKLIAECDCVISQEGIRLEINPILNPPCGAFACDVEHDEAGGMVGIGICVDTWGAYFTMVTPQLKEALETGSLVMHNGVSDIECLRM
jgi:hypothetical protein